MYPFRKLILILPLVFPGLALFAHQAKNSPKSVNPVKLSDFKVFKFQQNKVYLEWVTESEHNNLKFVVERSLDGEHFSFVGEVNGIGNSIKKHWYDFVDPSPKIGKNFYRLKQLDLNGQENIIDNIEVIEIQKVIDDFMVMPNPTNEDIEVSFLAFKQGLVSVKIISLSGLTLKDFYLLSEEGLNNFQIDLSDLEKGEYTIALSDYNQETFTDRITKTY